MKIHGFLASTSSARKKMWTEVVYNINVECMYTEFFD